MRSSYSIKVLAPALFAALVATVATLPARADAQIEQSKEVRYDDLNLDQAAGVEQLYRRLQGAATNVCDSRYKPGTLFVDPKWRTCMADALAQAVAAVDRPAVTAYHAARTSQPDARGNQLAAADARN